ncbi:hypothetical protein GGI35DRAFT_315805 [Trichoderma velutinum]
MFTIRALSAGWTYPKLAGIGCCSLRLSLKGNFCIPTGSRMKKLPIFLSHYAKRSEYQLKLVGGLMGMGLNRLHWDCYKGLDDMLEDLGEFIEDHLLFKLTAGETLGCESCCRESCCLFEEDADVEEDADISTTQNPYFQPCETSSKYSSSSFMNYSPPHLESMLRGLLAKARGKELMLHTRTVIYAKQILFLDAATLSVVLVETIGNLSWM